MKKTRQDELNYKEEVEQILVPKCPFLNTSCIEMNCALFDNFDYACSFLTMSELLREIKMILESKPM